MPIYEYKCSDCGAQFERMQKVSDAPLIVCEVCGGRLEKQWSLSGFQFKGAGWYVTDYSNKSKDPNAAKSPDQPEKSVKAETAGNAEKTEKTSAAESTVKTEAASNNTNDAAASSKKDAAAKKD